MMIATEFVRDRATREPDGDLANAADRPLRGPGPAAAHLRRGAQHRSAGSRRSTSRPTRSPRRWASSGRRSPRTDRPARLQRARNPPLRASTAGCRRVARKLWGSQPASVGEEDPSEDRRLAMLATVLFLVAACGGGGASPSASRPATTPAATSAAPSSSAAPSASASAAPSASAPASMTAEPSASMTAEPSASASASAPGTSPPAGGFDPSTISGDLKLAGFSAGNVEDKIRPDRAGQVHGQVPEHQGDLRGHRR